MPEAPLRLAAIGCGRIAGAYLQAVRQVPDLELVAVVDPDPGRAAAAAAASGATALGDVDALLGGAIRCDAALVLTPPDTHEPISVRCLEAGLHVLCEKPLAPSTAAASRMLQTAQARGRLLMMGSKFRYSPDVTRARALLDEGRIGEVLMFENVFCTHVDMSGRWNAVRAVAGGGVLVDNGCHAVDIARYLLGPIARVQAWFGRPVQRLEVEDTARLLFESAAGAMGVVDVSWSLHKQVPWYVRLYGSRGMIELGWQQSRCQPAGTSEWTAFGRGYDKVGAFAAQLADFAGAARGRQAPLITDADALASVRVIEVAYRSSSEQRWHEL